MKRVVLILVIAMSHILFAQSQWPQFRGPGGDGVVDLQGLPYEWSESQNVKWKTAIHDLGYSTPVILNNQVWFTTATPTGEKMYAVCLDLKTGKVVHDILVFTNTDPQGIHKLNSYATPSATIEAGRVYVHFGTFGTACLDSQTGKKIWEQRGLHIEHMQGPSASPIIYKNLLIVHMDGTDVQYIVAMDKNTGKVVWKTERPQEFYKDVRPVWRKGYTTPLLINWKGKTQLISVAGQVVQSLNPDTGDVYWNVVVAGDSPVPSPVFWNGLVYVNGGYHSRTPSLWAVAVDGSGNVTDTHVKWKTDQHISNEASPVVKDGLLYVVNDRGEAACLDAATGDMFWEHRLSGKYGASILLNQDKVYFFSKKGLCTVVRAGKTLEILAENQLDDGFYASAAAVDKSLILRTSTHVYCIME